MSKLERIAEWCCKGFQMTARVLLGLSSRKSKQERLLAAMVALDTDGTASPEETAKSVGHHTALLRRPLPDVDIPIHVTLRARQDLKCPGYILSGSCFLGVGTL